MLPELHQKLHPVFFLSPLCLIHTSLSTEIRGLQRMFSMLFCLGRLRTVLSYKLVTKHWWHCSSSTHLWRDQSTHKGKVEQLTVECKDKNLLLNTVKTKELIVDFRKKANNIMPLRINEGCVEKVWEYTHLRQWKGPKKTLLPDGSQKERHPSEHCAE